MACNTELLAEVRGMCTMLEQNWIESLEPDTCEQEELNSMLEGMCASLRCAVNMYKAAQPRMISREEVNERNLQRLADALERVASNIGGG